MTGHGEAHRQQDDRAIAVEVRSVNNKYFKLIFRAADAYLALESQVESLVRESIRRGTVQVSLRIDRRPSADDFQLNEIVLSSYRRQLEAIEHHLQLREPIRLESLLGLPGVVVEQTSRLTSLESDWPVVRETIAEALSSLTQMRGREGTHMASDLHANIQLLTKYLSEIEVRAPQVVEAYRLRFHDRLKNWLAQHGLEVQASDLIREVGMFAERCDISEEIVRLQSHLAQFESYVDAAESTGRKLDFLTQEMIRETNTIGSKANDAVIARSVIEMKGMIERIREMIQNVE